MKVLNEIERELNPHHYRAGQYNQVLDVDVIEGGVRFTEQCDQYFYYDLTKEQLGQFITELQEIYDKL